MGMSPDTSSLAAKRVQMESVKPVRDSAGQRLAAQSSLEANGNVKRRRPEGKIRRRKIDTETGGQYDIDTEAQSDPDDDKPKHGNDGEDHLLDVMA